MKSKYVKERFQFIEDSIKRVENANLNDAQLNSMLSSYLIVLISGIYEDCIESLFVLRAAKSRDKEITNFIKVFLSKHFRNPDFNKILNLLGSLNPNYAKRLKSQIALEAKEAINSIVRNKNRIAHGAYSNATISDIRYYHTSATAIFLELERVLFSKEKIL